MTGDGDWLQSTEGDLDPDLTEEAGYGPWDPPPRRRWQLAFRLLFAAVLVSIIGGALLAVRW